MRINIKDLAQANIVAVRTVPNQIRELVESKPTDYIILDFSEINLISGSAAQGFLKLKEDLAKRKIVAIFENITSEIEEILAKVQTSRYAEKPSRPNLVASKVSPFSMIDKLVEF